MNIYIDLQTFVVQESQNKFLPGVQSVQSVALTRPGWLLKVPFGHLVPIALPVGQYLPGGQTSPVIPSFGVEVLAPSVQ